MMRSREPGAAAAGIVPLSIPDVSGNEWLYVKECLDTGWISSVGPFVERFERELAARTGTSCAVAVVNGTAALHLALLVAGVRPGDEVLMPALSFIAPANAVTYVGAVPAFVDVDPRYWQMDPAKTVEFLAGCERRVDGLVNRKSGRRIGALLPVHILGHPVDMDPVLEVARRHGIPVIEDATESLGASYKDRPVGHLGDLACFSFNGNKIISCGGGGMIVTDRADLAARARYLSTQAKDDPLEYVHGTVGYNYRLTNVLAAIGCAQLERLDEYLSAKRRIAHQYAAAFRDMPGIEFMQQAPWAQSSFWLSTVLLERAADSRALIHSLDRQGIQARPLWQPLHLSPAHVGAGAYSCEVATALAEKAVSLPCSVAMPDLETDRVINAVTAFLATR